VSDKALQAARDRLVARGARLGEVRMVERQLEWLQVRNGKVETCTRTVSRGLGIRALAGGWGFAASDDLSDPVAVADRAVDLAESVGHLSYDHIEVGGAPPTAGPLGICRGGRPVCGPPG
jgi:predicted Zn-dependent protease